MPLNMWKFLSLTSLFLILLESILSFWLQNTMSGDSPHKSQREGYCRICKHLGLPSHPHVCIIEHGLWLLRWLEYKCVHESAMTCVSALILVKSESSLVKSIKTLQIFGTILLNLLVLYLFKPSLTSTSKFVHNISLTGDMLYSITWLLKKTASLEKRIGKGQVTLKTEK